MNCLECGQGHLEPSPVSLTGERHGEKFTVNMEGLRCPECGFETVDSDQSVELTRLISDAYRAAHGFSSSLASWRKSMCCAVSIRYEPRQLDALIAIDCFKP